MKQKIQVHYETDAGHPVCTVSMNVVAHDPQHSITVSTEHLGEEFTLFWREHRYQIRLLGYVIWCSDRDYLP